MDEIEQTDPIIETLKTLGQQLTAFTGTGLLENGKCEKQLKLFLARTWMGAIPIRACLMDKRFNRSEIDLLGLENGAPSFWMETKCSFRQDPGEAKKSARSAISQVNEARLAFCAEKWREGVHRSDVGAFREAIRLRPGYIVHFLNSVPVQRERYPMFVVGRYPSEPAITREALRDYYGRLLEHFQPGIVRATGFSVHPAPDGQIDGVALKFTWA